MEVLKKALENENIEYRCEYVGGEFFYIDTFSHIIEIFVSDIDGKYVVGTYKDLSEERKNERSIKSVKAVLNYINRYL